MPPPGSNRHTRVPRGSNQCDALLPSPSKRRNCRPPPRRAGVSACVCGGAGAGGGTLAAPSTLGHRPVLPLRRCHAGPAGLPHFQGPGAHDANGPGPCPWVIKKSASYRAVLSAKWASGRGQPRAPAQPLRKPQTRKDPQAQVASSTGEEQNFILQHGRAPCYQRRPCAFPLPSFAAA